MLLQHLLDLDSGGVQRINHMRVGGNTTRDATDFNVYLLLHRRDSQHSVRTGELLR